MENLETKFIVQNNYISKENIIVVFVITNNSNQDLYLLKWGTPLEGLKSDCLKITSRRNVQIDYDGILLKRGQPGSDAFIKIKAKSSLKKEINLSLAYDLNSEDEYTIEFNSQNLVVVSPSSIKNHEFISTAEISNTSISEISNNSSTFSVTESGEKNLTIGQLNRMDSKKKENNQVKSFPSISVIDPKLVGGTEAQRRKVKLAHTNGYSLMKQSIAKLRNDSSYKTWFGLYKEERFEKVKATYSKIKYTLDSKVFTYNLSGEGCESDTYAYTTKGGGTIWLCDLFWKAPETGINSKAGTIVHEYCHASASLEDIIIGGIQYYGQKLCKELALKYPDKSVQNADNYEYYSEVEIKTYPF